MSANTDLITMETYLQQGENSFSYASRGPNVKKNIFWATVFGGPGRGGVFYDRTGPILIYSYPLTDIYVHVK